MQSLNINKALYRKPINIAIIYSAFTLLLYLFGPYAFPEYNRFLLVLFVVITNIALYIGFVSGSNKNYVIRRPLLKLRLNKILKVFFIIALLVSVPKFIIYTGFYHNPVSRTLGNIVLFFSGASDVIYAARQELGNAPGVWRYINYFVVLLGPIHWIYTPIAMFYWKSLSFLMKTGTIIIWAVYVLQYICTGTNVGLFEFIISLFIVKVIRNIYNGASIVPKKKKIKTKSNVFIIICLLTALLFAFDFVMSSRIGDQTSSCPIGNRKAYLDTDSIFWNIVPVSIQQVFMYVTRYVSAPYYALERAFELSFTSTFGVGYSWFLLDNFPIDLWPDTYMMKLEEYINYNHFSSWHTSYLWFANDVSFLGVPIVYYFIYKLFGKCWAMFLQTKNMCAFALFMLFIKMTFFISANNQAFQSSDHLLAFWGLLFLLGYSRRFNWKDA